MKRRDFLRTIGISSTATAAACSFDPVSWDPMVPMEKAYPYLIQPEEVIPGVSSFYATRCGQCDAGCGVVARVREGRVVKLEGNDLHPLNAGRLCSNGQSALQDSYTPDRFSGPSSKGQATEWSDAVEGLGNTIKGNQGKILWVGRYRSGASKNVLEQFASVNKIDVHLWEPDGSEAQIAAVKNAYGVDSIPSYRLDNAEVILSFGMDFLGADGNVELSNGWANSRDPSDGAISKTYTVSPRIGASEAISDKHLRCKIGSEAGVALAIAKKLSQANGYNGPASAALSGIQADKLIEESGVKSSLIDDIVSDIKESKLSVALPGGLQTSSQPTALATAALLINEVAGNIGRSVQFDTVDLSMRSSAAKIKEAIGSSKYNLVLIDGVDLAYDFSSSPEFVSALGSIANVFVFENEPNATTALANATVLPPGTVLERWGDGNERSGVHTIQQAVMDPMQRPEGQQRSTRSVENILLAVAGNLGQKAIPAVAATDETSTEDSPAEEVVTEGEEAVVEPAVVYPLPDLDKGSFQAYLYDYWAANVLGQSNETDPKKFWIDSLQRGGFFMDAPTHQAVSWKLSAITVAPPAGDKNLIVFPHPRVGFARNANRSWLQEVSDSLTSFSWSTWVEVSEGTANKYGLTKDKGVEITANNKTFTAGWYLSPGIGDDTIAICGAGGQTDRGRYAKIAAENGGSALSLVGFSTDEGGAMQVVGQATIKASTALNAPSPRNNLLKSDTLTMNHRGVNFTVYKGALGTKEGAGSIVPAHHLPDSSMAIRARSTKSRFNPDETLTDMYPEPEHPTYRFAMAIDLNRCTGCAACEVACYAENNIPVTGPEEARLSRRMSWIRLSTYWEGDGETPDIRFQPNMCQQCSHAPCEGVCPVLATYHNIDGLNAMIYNRCVGTRYCGNNCPYSARRFNYHTYRWPESFNLMLNPDVMAREMGVMEKCTFCIQRLRAVKDEHRDSVGFEGQGSAVSADKLFKLTACAQACPSNAITFGNLKDKESAVAKSFEEPRAYKFLNELNTKPGVVYLARVVHEKSEQWKHAFEHGSHGDDKTEQHNDSDNNGH